MRVRYRLPVSGCLRIDMSFPVTNEIFTYDFEANAQGVVTHLNATARVPNRSEWPRIHKSNEEGFSSHIHLSAPFLDSLRREVRAASGILALFGVEEVSIDDAEEFWEAESEEEKAALQLSAFRIQKKSRDPATFEPISFDLVARALLVASQATGFEMALGFYRKGRVNVNAEQYLDAVLDYLFMLETTYANGKFRTAHVEAEYLSSSELRTFIRDVQVNDQLRWEMAREPRVAKKLQDTYLHTSVEEVVGSLISLRGELHHHNSRKNGIWHPTDHMRYGADALFLEYLCSKVAFSIMDSVFFGKTVISAYATQAQTCDARGLVKKYRA